MTLLNDNGLLREQLGKNSVDVITTTAMTGKNYYAIHFPIQSVITSISASNVNAGGGSAIGGLHTTMAAGTTLFLQVTAITLASGLAICYYEQGY